MITEIIVNRVQNVKVKTLSKMARRRRVNKNTTVKHATLTERSAHPYNIHPNAKLRFFMRIMNEPVCTVLNGHSASLVKQSLNGSKKRQIHCLKCPHCVKHTLMMC